MSDISFPEDTVGLIVWSAAEIAVTLICIGIGVCRPLYKRYIDQWTSRDGSKYVEHSEAGSYALRTFGGGNAPRRGKGQDDSEADSITIAERRLGIGKPFSTKAYAIGGNRLHGDSDEEILGPDFRRSQHRRKSDVENQGKGMAGIRVTEEYEVTTSRLNI